MAIFGWTRNKRKAAHEWIEKGDRAVTPEEQFHCYDKAIESDPNYAGAWYRKGSALHNLKRYDEAIQCWDRAIESNPNDAGAWYRKGVALDNLKRCDEAIRCYDRAIEINPNYAGAWNDKGNALHNLKRYDEATHCYNKVIEIYPNNVGAWYRKGVALSDLNRYDEAIQCYDKSIEIYPNYANAWKGKGNALCNLNRYDEAIRCYDKAIQIDPNDDPNDAVARKNKDIALDYLKRYAVFESLLKINFSFSEIGLEYNTWQVHTLTVANTGTTQLNNITLSFSGDIEVRGIRPFSLPPSEQKSYECSFKATARGTVPVEVTVTARNGAGTEFSTTYEYSIQVSDPQGSTSPLPTPPVVGEQTVPPDMFSLERTIYDPVLQDFLVSSKRPLVNVRRWIEDRDPKSYWCVICIHNKSESPVDEWGIELNSTSSLKVVDAYIEGHEGSATVRESHSMPWLSQWVIGVSHHSGIVIPRSGSRRIYVRLGSDACGVSHSIKGRFMTSHGVEVPIREKTFTHSCDVTTLRVALSKDPATAEKYAQNVILRDYDRDTGLKILQPLRQVQEINQYCALQKYDEVLRGMRNLAATLEVMNAGDNLTNPVKQCCDALEILGDGEASVKRAQQCCTNIYDIWINEFIISGGRYTG